MTRGQPHLYNCCNFGTIWPSQKCYFDTFISLRNHVYAESYDASHCLLAKILSNFEVQPYEDHLDHVVDITTVTKKRANTKGSDNQIETMPETESTPET